VKNYLLNFSIKRYLDNEEYPLSLKKVNVGETNNINNNENADKS
jgi:hypothetical protein